VTLRELVKSGFDVAAVLTREDAPVGRSKTITPSAVADAAAELNIPIIKSNRLDDHTLSLISHHKIDLGVVVAYGSFLNLKALSALPKGWLNLHYSLLPKYRGAAPVQWAILNGENLTGVTLFKLDEGMDTGPILMSVEAEIQPHESSGDLLDRLTHLGISILAEALPLVASGLAKFNDQPAAGTLAPKLKRADARIDWSLSAKVIEQQVRAMKPEPMAWCEFANNPLRILEAIANNRQSLLPVGTVYREGVEVLVACGGSTVLKLLVVQPAGKSEMAASSWANGLQSQEVKLD
jgi:methionyl-tRNA formyltransferase